MIKMKTSKLKLTTMMQTMLLMLSGHLLKARRNLAKPVSHEDITAAIQKAVPLKTQRQ